MKTFSIMEAQHHLSRVLREVPSAGPRLERLYAITLARLPSPREREWVDGYLKKQVALFERGGAEMVFPVELPGFSRVETAAWTELASVLLNVDEFITRE